MSKPAASLSDLLGGLAPEAAQAIEAALIRAVSLGESVASIARTIMQSLQTSLFRALTVARNVIMGGFRDVVDAVFGTSDGVIGWTWIAQLESACIACILMHGTVHAVGEEMDSHVNCGCTKEPLLANSTPMQSGEDWFNEQDDSTQEDILGSTTRYDAWRSGTVSLADMVGVKHDPQYGKSIYIKSLQALGVR